MLTRPILLIAMILGMFVPTGADAQVVITFAAKRGDPTALLQIPHGYMRITGTTESGEAIDRTLGLMPSEGSNLLLFGQRVAAEIVDSPASMVEWDRVQPFISVQIPDTTLDAIIVRLRSWSAGENGGYGLYTDNCIAFVGDMARTIGLRTPPGRHLSPSGFMRDLAAMNPPGSVPGVLPSPVPNPAPEDISPHDPGIAGPETAPVEIDTAPPSAGPPPSLELESEPVQRETGDQP